MFFFFLRGGNEFFFSPVSRELSLSLSLSLSFSLFLSPLPPTHKKKKKKIAHRVRPQHLGQDVSEHRRPLRGPRRPRGIRQERARRLAACLDDRLALARGDEDEALDLVHQAVADAGAHFLELLVFSEKGDLFSGGCCCFNEFFFRFVERVFRREFFGREFFVGEKNSKLTTTTQIESDLSLCTKSAPSLTMSGIVITPNSAHAATIREKYPATSTRRRSLVPLTRREKRRVDWAERTMPLPMKETTKVPMKIFEEEGRESGCWRAGGGG